MFEGNSFIWCHSTNVWNCRVGELGIQWQQEGMTDLSWKWQCNDIVMIWQTGFVEIIKKCDVGQHFSYLCFWYVFESCDGGVSHIHDLFYFLFSHNFKINNFTKKKYLTPSLLFSHSLVNCEEGSHKNCLHALENLVTLWYLMARFLHNLS